MGRKGHNWKARNISEVEIDDRETKKIPIDIEHREDNYDSCNALVLPSNKRKTKSKEKKVIVTRILSKKRRKQLEKIVMKKKKKLERAALLEELAKVQAPQEELKHYLSLTTLQTKGLKRHFRELEAPTKERAANKKGYDSQSESVETVVNAVKGTKKKRLAIVENENKELLNLDPNVVGLNESSDTEVENDQEENKDVEDLDNNNDTEEVNNIIQSTVNENLITEDINTEEKESKKREQNADINILNTPAKLKEYETANIINNIKRTPAVFVTLDRKPEIQAARLKLPVVAEEQIIVETINENPVVIVTGETGSGKTTQIPQFLYEAGYARSKLIGITEPRRVAAMSMSKRVAEEMNLSEKEVSYLMRFEGNVTSETKIKFMTDGVLLKEIQNDFLLMKYSVLILDEAHERSIYTDILIGLLSRIVPLRNKRKDPLKLIIMSATLHVEEFVDNPKLFKVKPPVVTVDSRQFPVTIHFNKKTSEDYVKDALRKAIKIHTRLPEGGILIFLTGQREVNWVVRKLRQTFPLKKNRSNIVKSLKTDDSEICNLNINKKDCEADDEEQNSDDDFDSKEAIRRNKQKQKKHFELSRVNLDDYSVMPSDDTHEDLINVENGEDESNLDEDEDEDGDSMLLNGLSDAQPLWVLPLYSLLPGYKQARVFEKPPENCRLCVVATNVAETSLTIPNIKYVIDCGRCKTRIYDKVTGVSTYKICYTSKAAANQRAGRSARMGPGHCYRLYSSAVFNDQFEQFSMSEIQRKPVDDLVLQMKVMNITKVINFPFPTTPDPIQLKMAEKRLQILGALKQPTLKEEDTCNAKITPLGRSIAAFPVAPRYGKMLALSHQYDLLQYTICMVAALSVQELLIEGLNMECASKQKWLQIRRTWAGLGNSLLLGDLMVLIKAVGAAEYAGFQGRLEQFCEDNGLRHKAVVEIRKLRQQLTNEINLNVPDLNLAIDPRMPPPIDMQAKLLRQVVLAGMGDHVARKLSHEEIKDQDKNKWKHAYKALEMEDPVFMHSTCVLRKTSPEWVVYQEIYETNKMYMRGVTAIEPEWLPKFVPMLCSLSDPLAEPPARYDSASGKIMCFVKGTFGRGGWELPMMEVEYPENVEAIKWFARFFLEGEVCPKLKRFVPSLLSTPGSVNKSWAKLLPRTEAITKTLLSERITSKSKLLEVWNTDKTFLLSAYQKWLPESAHAEVSMLWPPI